MSTPLFLHHRAVETSVREVAFRPAEKLQAPVETAHKLETVCYAMAPAKSGLTHTEKGNFSVWWRVGE